MGDNFLCVKLDPVRKKHAYEVKLKPFKSGSKKWMNREEKNALNADALALLLTIKVIFLCEVLEIKMQM